MSVRCSVRRSLKSSALQQLLRLVLLLLCITNEVPGTLKDLLVLIPCKNGIIFCPILRILNLVLVPMAVSGKFQLSGLRVPSSSVAHHGADAIRPEK